MPILSQPAKRLLLRVASVCLWGTAAGYVVSLAFRDLQAARQWWSSIHVGLLAISVLALMGALVPFGLATVVNLRMMGHRVPIADGCRAYFLSQVGKYVPGKVWLFAIRGGFYTRWGIPAGVAALSMTVEVLLTISSALIVALAMFPLCWTIDWPLSPYVTVLLLVGMLVPCTPRVLNWIVRFMLARRPRTEPAAPIGIVHIAAVLACYLTGWLAIGLGFLILAQAFAPLPPTVYPDITAAFALACTAGYLVLLAPAGLGVRELVLTGILTPLIGPAQAAGLAIMARVWWTISEMGCVAVALLSMWFLRRPLGTRPLDSKASPDDGCPTREPLSIRSKEAGK